MRSIIPCNLILIVMLFICVACGGGKSTQTDIVVSSSFSISNTGYDGGLTFYGKSVDGTESFAYSSLPNSTQNKIVLDLKKGNWILGVVGWAGASNGLNLKGTPYCGTVIVNLSAAEQTVNLTATAANCLSSVFTSSGNVNPTPSPAFKNLRFNFCPKISTGNAETGASFCQEQALDESFGHEVWSMRIQLPSKPLPGDTATQTPIRSNCITATSLGYIDLASDPYKLPTKHLPLNILAFKDKNCQSPINAYTFENGLEQETPFDKNYAFPTGSGNPQLFLASTRTKNEASPLLSVMPEISCAGESCGFIRPLPSGVDYVINPYSSNDYSEIVLSETGSCDDFAAFQNLAETPDGGDLTFYPSATSACRVDDRGKVLLTVKPSNATSCTPTNPCKISYTAPGAANTYKYLSTKAVEMGDQLRYQEIIAETLGFNNYTGTNLLINSMPHLSHTKKTNGILHNVREMFSGNGAGGAFKEFTSCSDISGVKYLSIFDEGTYKSVRITAISINEDVPLAIRTSANDTFDKRIAVAFPGSNLSYVTTQVMKIDCNKPIGMNEEYHSENNRIERSLLYWNTDSSNNSRIVQEYRMEQSATETRTSYTEVSGESLGLAGTMIKKMEYEAYKNSNDLYSGHIKRFEIFTEDDAAGTVTTNFKEFSHNDITTSNEHIFGLSEFKSALSASSIHQLDANQNTVIHAQSPNGEYRVIIDLPNSMQTGNLKVQSSTHLISQTFTISNLPGKIAVAMNNAGKGMIVKARNDGVLQFAPFTVSNGSLNFQTGFTNSEFSANTDGEPRLFYGNDDYITVGVRHGDGKVKLVLIKADGTKSAGNLSTTVATTNGSGDQFAISHNENAANNGTASAVCYKSINYAYCELANFQTATPTTTQKVLPISGATSLNLYPEMRYNGSGWDLNMIAQLSVGTKFYTLSFNGNALLESSSLQTDYNLQYADSALMKASSVLGASTSPLTTYEFDSKNFPVKRRFNGKPETLKPSEFVNVFTSLTNFEAQ